MDEECKHGLDLSWCAACKHPYRDSEPVTIEATFRAKFVGQCSACNLPIYVTQIIHKMSDDTYRHQGCEP